MIGLTAILDIAEPGARILMVSYGSGAGSDAFDLRVTDRITEVQRRAPSTRDYINRRCEIDYLKPAKLAPPIAGATTAAGPSPPASPPHAVHSHRVRVKSRQEDQRSRARASLDAILTIPLLDLPLIRWRSKDGPVLTAHGAKAKDFRLRLDYVTESDKKDKSQVVLHELYVGSVIANEIEYDSPLSRAQKSEQVVGIARTFEVLAPLASAQPQIFDVFDGDALAQLAAEVNGVPQKVLNTPEEIQQMRESRNASQQLQGLLAAAPAANQAAGALEKLVGSGAAAQ